MSSERIYEEFGQAVATRRKQLRLTQNKLATKTGMSRASIANIERGRQNVALHHIYTIAAALEIPKVSDLLPATKNSTKREEETMIASSSPVTPKGRAQVSDLVNSVLVQGGQKRSET